MRRKSISTRFAGFFCAAFHERHRWSVIDGHFGSARRTEFERKRKRDYAKERAREDALDEELDADIQAQVEALLDASGIAHDALRQIEIRMEEAFISLVSQQAGRDNAAQAALAVSQAGGTP